MTVTEVVAETDSDSETDTVADSEIEIDSGSDSEIDSGSDTVADSVTVVETLADTWQAATVLDFGLMCRVIDT